MALGGGGPTFETLDPQTQAAVAYAERMHAGQRRADGTPFILHPLEVASLLHDNGAPDHLIAAGVMHDLIEKTGVSASDLRQGFGPRITALVVAVSDDEQIAGYAKRKAALRRQVSGAGDEALTLFAADKLSKVRELRRETADDSKDGATPGRVRAFRARRLKHYHRSLTLLEERQPGSALVRELRDELAALPRERTILLGSAERRSSSRPERLPNVAPRTIGRESRRARRVRRAARTTTRRAPASIAVSVRASARGPCRDDRPRGGVRRPTGASRAFRNARAAAP